NARALIDRGVPFALTTATVSGAHLQAVVGYDPLRGSLFLRDPSDRHLGEVLGEEFLESYRSVGPRGLALVPRQKAALLDGVELLDAELYDYLYRMRCALDAHDRPAAVECVRALEAQAPEHRLTLQAHHVLANYDGNSAELLGVLDRLLQLFPDDPIS